MEEYSVLVVDDDPALLPLMEYTFAKEGYEVYTAADGREALRQFYAHRPDLIILDIMMPGMDGWETCRCIREVSDVPILMLTARGQDEDIIRGLEYGADDYMTKPFGKDELIARVKAVIRRTEATGTMPAQPSFTAGDLEINFVQRRVTVAGEEIKLTPTEYNLLQELTLNAGKVLTHTHLLNKVWGMEYREEREYLRVFIRRLRAKLGRDPTAPQHIINVPAVGYKFEDKA